MGSAGTAATNHGPSARHEASFPVQEENGENAEGNTGRTSNNCDQQNCRQSPQFIKPSMANGCLPAPPSSKLFHTAVQTPQILSLFGVPKDGSFEFLKPLFMWLFPNLLVALVFAVTLTACLMCNATIQFDMCFLLLLIASWAFLAAAARRRGAEGPHGELMGCPQTPSKPEAMCGAKKKVSGVEVFLGQGQAPPSPSAGERPSCSALEDVRTDVINFSGAVEEEGGCSMRWGLSKLRSSCSRHNSSSINSFDTATPRSISRQSVDEEGLCEEPHQAAVEEEPVAVTHDASQGEGPCAEGQGGYVAGKDFFPFLREEESAVTAEERERTIVEIEETEEREISSEEAQRRYSCDDASPVAPVPASSTSGTSTEFSLWPGALGEVTVSSIADLSFCRTQTLAAELSPHKQSMSIEMEASSLPALPFSCLGEAPDNRGTSTTASAGVQNTAPTFTEPSREKEGSQQGASVEAVLPYIVSEEAPQGVTTETADVVSLGNLLEHQLQQQQLLLMDQLQRNNSLPRGGPSALSPMPARRGGGPRRAGGAPVGGKIQRRESRAALQYYMGLVKDCCKRRDGAGALSVLEEVQREGRVAPDVQLLNYVLFACVASQDGFLTKRLFEFIEDAGVADIVTYNTMLKSFSLSGQLEEAEKILKRMRGRNVLPDEVSFNLLVNAAVSCGRIDRAWHYVDELRTAHMVPDKFTISSLVKSLQPGQNVKLIQRTLRLMDGVDVCEDLILLSTCIDATLRLGDMERLRRLLDRFESSSLSPNAHAYGTLIKAYGRLGNLSRVWALWRDLQNKKNMEPTNYTYGCMLDILLSNNLLADATQLFCRMVQQGVVDAVHFSILVKGLSKYSDQGVRLALEAYSVLQSSTVFRRGGAGEGGGKNSHGRDGERSQSQLALNTISFNALLHLCVVNGRMDDALRLFHDMERQDTVAPDLISYSTVIKGLCCCAGDAPLERALSLLDQMQKRYGIRPDAIVFNTLIQGAATRKNPALVEHLLNLMQQSNVPPSSYTLCQCVKLYGKCNNLQRALELANELPSRFGFTIDGYVYTALIAACVSNGAAVLAGQLALQANSSGIEIPPGVLCRLWNTLHFTRATQEENGDSTSELNAVYEAIWKLVGSQSKDPSSIGLEGIGVRRSRRRGGKQHTTNFNRQKQQQGCNSSAPIVSGPSCLPQEQQRHAISQGAVSSFISAIQRDWEGNSDRPIMRAAREQPDMEAAAMWSDTNTANNGFPW